MTQRTRIAILIPLLVTLFLASAGFAHAKSLTVWPGSFRATDPDVPGYAISQSAIRGPGAALVFDAPLTLTGVDPVVRKGYRYFIEVDLYHLVSSCGGFKVTYTPPAH